MQREWLISNADLQPPVYDAYLRPFSYGLFRINILKVRFWEGGGGHKKEYAVYARENDDNYGRPLTGSDWILVNYLVLN